MFEKEFNKAKNNVINLLIKEKLIDNVNHSYLKSLSKEDMDTTLSIKELVKKDSLKLNIRKSKLIEFEYTKLLLLKYLSEKYSYLSAIERKVCTSLALKNIFKIKEMPDKAIELKEDILEYAKHVKTGTYFYSFIDCLNNAKVKAAYGEDWDKIINALQEHDAKIKTNPNAREELLRAQRIAAESALKDLAKFDDVSDYIVRTQLIFDTPVSDISMLSELLHKYDIEFLRNNRIDEISGLTKIYALRDTLSSINDETKTDENKYRYIQEYNYLVKAFNKLPKTSKR